MDSPAPGPPRPSNSPGESAQLRERTADTLRDRSEAIASAALEGVEKPWIDEPDLVPLGSAVARLLTAAVRSGTSDPLRDEVAGLVTLVNTLGLEPQDLFALVFRAMHAGVVASTTTPLSSDDAAAAAPLVQRAAFDLLAAWATRALELPNGPAVTDALTTLHTRVIFDTVLEKECRRAERFEHWLSVLLIDIDHLAAVNRLRGNGVGDQVLERVGILIRKYFRQQDWVARYSDATVAVLLPATGPEDAVTLANLMRAMIEERVAVDDERTRPVTVSVAAVSARPLNGHPIDPDRVFDELDAALDRVKDGDRTRVELVEIYPVIEGDLDAVPGE
jgi:diguanylate cyclase (GGDEF)-like protein